MSPLKKLTTILIVDHIEAQLPSWQALGYRVTTRVPEQGPAGFVILNGAAGELMLQTRASLAEDLPQVAALRPSSLLYADVTSLAEARKELSAAKPLVFERKTFYGATESWFELPEAIVLGLAQHGE
jgi:hypothetical protein